MAYTNHTDRQSGHAEPAVLLRCCWPPPPPPPQMVEEHRRRYKELTSAALHDADQWVHSRVMQGQQRAFTTLKECYMPVAKKKAGTKREL